MYSFMNDYSEMAHPKVWQALTECMEEQNIGYGLDRHTQKAVKHIKQILKNEEVDIHFMQGGTITNATMISHSLRPYEAVISADIGHINVHETGAIEATGHKVISVLTEDGKLSPAMIRKVLEGHTDEHMVFPKMVYISNPTEIGTVYSKKELEVLYQFCTKKHLILYVDGARLAMALAVKEAELTLEDITNYTDIFYIGGTKVGAVCGEAVVISNPSLKDKFRFSMKHQGGMMAKGFFIGIQFLALFQNNLYIELGKHANAMAERLREMFVNAGVTFWGEAPTNQVFVVLDNTILEEIEKEYIITRWGKAGDTQTIARFCTSFATKAEDIEEFCAYFKNLLDRAGGIA